MSEAGDRGKALMLSWLRQLEKMSQLSAQIATQQAALMRQQAQLLQSITDLHVQVSGVEERVDGIAGLLMDDDQLLEHTARSGARSVGASIAQGLVRGAFGPFRGSRSPMRPPQRRRGPY